MSIDPKNYWQDENALPPIENSEFSALNATLKAPRDREILAAFVEAYHAEATLAARQARAFDITHAINETISAALSGAVPKKIATWFPGRFERPVAAPLQIYLSVNGFTGEMWRDRLAKLDAGDKKLLRAFIAAFDAPGDGISLDQAAVEVSTKLLTDYRLVIKKIRTWFAPPPAPKLITSITQAAAATTKPKRGRKPKPKPEPKPESTEGKTGQEDIPPPPEPPAPPVPPVPPAPPAPPVETAKQAGRNLTARTAKPNDAPPPEEKAGTIQTPHDLLLVARRVADACNKKSLVHYSKSIKHNLATMRSAVKQNPGLITLGNLSLMLNLLSQHLLLNEGPHHAPKSPYSIGRSVLTTVKFMSELRPDVLQANPILKERLNSLTTEHGHISSPGKPLHHEATMLLAEWRTLEFTKPSMAQSMPHSPAKEAEGWTDQHISTVYGGGERTRPKKPARRPPPDRSHKPRGSR